MRFRIIGKAGWRSLSGLMLAACILAVSPLGASAQAKSLDPSAAARPASEFVVGRGDTLYGLLRRAGVDAAGRVAVADALEDRFDPRSLRPGDRVRFDLQPHKGAIVVRRLSIERRAREPLVVDIGPRKVRVPSVGFIMPLKGGQLSSPFGWRIHPVFGDRRFHNGIDLRAPKGTPVSASADGVVVEARRHGNYGKYIRIRHKAGVETTYSHLSGFARGIHPGRMVQQGQVIGYVGRTGVATGNHLYYEMIVNGEYVDPLHPPTMVATHPDDEQLSQLPSPPENSRN